MCVGAMVVALIISGGEWKTSVDNFVFRFQSQFSPCKDSARRAGGWEVLIEPGLEEWCKRAPVDVMRRLPYKPCRKKVGSGAGAVAL